jgi:hypothetical protein
MKILTDVRFLAFYSGAATALLAVLLLTGFRQRESSKKFESPAKFESIDVRRINIVEPDGTLRMVISDKSAAPGAIIRGKEYAHPDRQSAGILFFNDEATENGGLIFGGAKDKNGQVESYGHLSFDQYEQDQVFTIESEDQHALHSSAVTIWDRPDFPIGDLLATPPEKRAEFLASHPKCHARIYLGRNQDRTVALRLKDKEGRDRIVLRVDGDGSPLIELLDKEGKIIRQLPEPAIPKKAK